MLVFFLYKIVYHWKSQELTPGGNLADIYGKAPVALMNEMLIT